MVWTLKSPFLFPDRSRPQTFFFSSFLLLMGTNDSNALASIWLFPFSTRHDDLHFPPLFPPNYWTRKKQNLITEKLKLKIELESWAVEGRKRRGRKEDMATGDGQMKGTLTHGGRYVLYNVYGNLFEVPAKYVPPLRPIGRGAYGIVWWVLIPPLDSLWIIAY